MGVVRSSSLGRFACGSGSMGVAVDGLSRPPMITTKMPITTSTPIGAVIRGTRRRRRRDLFVASPVIKAFCSTTTPSMPTFMGIKSRMGTKRAIYVLRTVGLVGRVRDSCSYRVRTILMDGRRGMRCKRPLFHIGEL